MSSVAPRNVERYPGYRCSQQYGQRRIQRATALRAGYAWHLRSFLLILGAVLLGGCGFETESAVRQREIPLTPAEIRTLGFEQVTDWYKYSGVGTL